MSEETERETGKELHDNNEQIVFFLNLLRNQRQEIDYLIDKQEQEKSKLEMEIERIYYKLTLISKSLAMRKKARVYYDQTIKELEEAYRKIVESSGVLLKSARAGAGQLEEMMDKKTGTSLDGDKAMIPNKDYNTSKDAPTRDKAGDPGKMQQRSSRASGGSARATGGGGGTGQQSAKSSIQEQKKQQQQQGKRTPSVLSSSTSGSSIAEQSKKMKGKIITAQIDRAVDEPSKPRGATSSVATPPQSYMVAATSNASATPTLSKPSGARGVDPKPTTNQDSMEDYETIDTVISGPETTVFREKSAEAMTKLVKSTSEDEEDDEEEDDEDDDDEDTTDSEDKVKHADDVSDSDAVSRASELPADDTAASDAPTKPASKKNLKAHDSAVEVFKKGYQSQHEKRKSTPAMFRNKK